MCCVLCAVCMLVSGKVLSVGFACVCVSGKVLIAHGMCKGKVLINSVVHVVDIRITVYI